MKYIIAMTLKDGATIVGYVLYCLAPASSLNGSNRVTLSKKDVIELAKRGLIANVRARKNGNVFILVGDGINLNDIPSQQIRRKEPNKMVITHRVYDGRHLVGYVVKNNHGQQVRITVADAVRLATNGQLANVKIQMYEDGPKLRGDDGFKMRDLPITYISDNNKRMMEI